MKNLLYILFIITSFSNPSIDKIQNLQKRAQTKDSVELAHIYIDLSEEYYTISDNQQSLKYALHARRLSQNLQLPRLEIESMILIGKNKELLSHGANIIDIYIQALNKAEAINNKRLIGLTKNRIGQFYYSINQYNLAMEYFIEALNIAEEYQLKELESMVVNNIGIIHYVNQDLDKALDNFLKSNLINEELHIIDPSSLNNIGLVYWQKGNLDKALNLFHQSLELNKKKKNLKEVSSQLNNIGLVYRDMGKLTTAFSWMERSLEKSRAIKDSYGEVNALINISGIYMEQKDITNANYLLKKALQISKENNYKELLLESYKGLALTNIFEKKYETALDFTNKQMALHNSIYTDKKNQAISQLVNAYELDKKQEQIDLLKKKKKVQLILWGGASILFIFITLFIAISLYAKNKLLKQKFCLLKQNEEINTLQIEKITLEKQKREQENELLQNNIEAKNKASKHQKEKHNLELEIKNKELSTIALMVNSKNDIINQICNKLKDLSKNLKAENRDKVSLMIHEVENSIDSDKEWQNFKKHFEMVHKNFFDKLKNLSPALTLNDIKLCAYMRINVSTKEISRILNISPAAVNQRRYRIREKLEIPKEISLFEYMRNI